MDVLTCRKCKKLFNYLSGVQICPTCRQELDKKFDEVKQYIYENEHATIEEVSEQCDVPKKQIDQWIKEERLILKSVTNLSCRNCGASIITGSYCVSCKNKLINGLSKTIEVEEQHSNIQKKSAAFHTSR